MMKTPLQNTKLLIANAVVSTLLVACSSTPSQPQQPSAARNQLTQLQSDPQLSKQAPVAIKEAEAAVRAAEIPQGDDEKDAQLMYLAERKVEIAQALAESRLLVEQRELLSQQRESVRLESRTQEVNNARSSAEAARMEALAAQQEAENARRNAEAARQKSMTAQQEAEYARRIAEAERLETLAAQKAASDSQQQAAELQRQIDEMNAKPTERGLVVTLGDVLFDTGKAQLKSGAVTDLTKLATFLNKYQDRKVLIEGHTDSVGNDDYNLGLSQRRADSVKLWLMNQGVNSDRIVSAGKGETSPVASNGNASGRQLNRRVEVIIENINTNPN